MPSIAAHMICAKIVSDKLKINDPEFIKGNLLPDIIDDKNSHNKIKGKHYYVPDIDYFLKKLDLKNHLYLGYLTHLLLDKYFLENYIYDVVDGKEVFLSRLIYREYDIINYRILKKFDINVSYLNHILKDFDVPINEAKYNVNMSSLNNTNMNVKPKLLDIDSFAQFLIDTSNDIVKCLKEVKEK